MYLVLSSKSMLRNKVVEGEDSSFGSEEEAIAAVEIGAFLTSLEPQ